MLFNSYIFILAFLPIVLTGYFSINHFKKYDFGKAFLIVCSLIFYGYFNWWYLIIIISSIIINYLCSYLMLKPLKDKRSEKKAVFAFSLAANIGSLFFLKYYDFFIENFNFVFKTSFNLLNIALPLGISFFTFQQLSYVIDSYHGKVPIYSIWDYSLFVSFFPQLVAGPIVLHNEMVPQFADISKKKFCPDNFAKGLWAFSLGLSKKVLLADVFGVLVDSAYGCIDSLGTLNAAMVMLAYTFQIYFDFSGYCDMATGIGKMMNIDITVNFNSPYKATDIVDFWKRWHITLTRFFTTYIYIPLGGNRKGTAMTYLNIMIVFLVSGIWHGANWTFIIWGIMHGIASVITRAIDKKTGFFTNKNHPLKKAALWLCTFIFINLTWVIFRADSVNDAIEFYKQLFGMNFTPLNNDFLNVLQTDLASIIFRIVHIPGNIAHIIAASATFIFSLYAVVFMKNTNERIQVFKPTAAKSAIASVLLFFCIMSFAGVSSFLYWNF